PRLSVTANLGEALTRLEELLIERRRTLQDEDADDLEAMRDADPMHPPMPPVLLLAEVPGPEARTRLTTTLHLGTPLQINVVLLDPPRRSRPRPPYHHSMLGPRPPPILARPAAHASWSGCWATPDWSPPTRPSRNCADAHWNCSCTWPCTAAGRTCPTSRKRS